MLVSEIFESIQGEGKYTGYPALFIRLSGCNLKCSFCDTKYHTIRTEKSLTEIINIINKCKLDIVVWTGGEPLLQIQDITNVVRNTKKRHHLETNGILIDNNICDIFEYVCVSPKDIMTCKKLIYSNFEIKVVTDLKLNKNLIPYATTLMPLSTFNKKIDKKIRQDVWDYCVKTNIKYSPRIHIDVWDKKRGT